MNRRRLVKVLPRLTLKALANCHLPGSITDSQSIFAWIGGAHESPVHRVNHDCLAPAHR